MKRILFLKAVHASTAVGWVPPTEAQAKSGNYLKPRIRWRGLEIAIESPAGSTRSGVDPNGQPWSVTMAYPYGYFVDSLGVDGDQVDVYIGPDFDADMVYVVHQQKVGDWRRYDEDKVFIGFGSEDEAKHAFLMQYDDPRFLGSVTAMSADAFIEKLRQSKRNPAMIKGRLARVTRI